MPCRAASLTSNTLRPPRIEDLLELSHDPIPSEDNGDNDDKDNPIPLEDNNNDEGDESFLVRGAQRHDTA